MKLRIRVDAPAYDRFSHFLQDKGVTVIACCYESPSNENPHYHLYAEVSGSIDALKRARSRFFEKDADMKGNGVASIQSMDQEQEYMEYMCKGTTVVKDPKTKMYYGKCPPDIRINNNNWNIQQLHESFWNRHKNDKPKKNNNFTLKLLQDWETLHIKNASEIFESYDELENKPTIVTVPVQLDIETHIVDWLIDYMSIESKPWDRFIVIRYMNLILFKYKQHFSTRSCKNAQLHVKQSILHSLGQSINRLTADDELFKEKYIDI